MRASRRGFYCAVNGCASKPNGTISFFLFPRDHNRRVEWIRACNRPTLNEKDEKFIKQTRVCAKHFEAKMFLNDLKNRLQPHAKPILFLSTEEVVGTATGATIKERVCSSVVMNCKFTMLEHFSAKLELFTCEWHTPRPYQCTQCPFETSMKASLHYHIRVFHDSSDSKIDINRILADYQCKKCDFQTSSLLLLLKHVQTCTQWEETVTDKRFKCAQCSYMTKKQAYLNAHYNGKHAIGADIKWYNCDQCDYKARWKSNLKQHNIVVHCPKEIKWFECDQCDFRTKVKYYLNRHVVAVHHPQELIKWFKCDQCDYKARRREQLKSHNVSSHCPDEIKWFQCDQCDFRTQWKPYLKTHMVTVHHPDEIKWFKCERCEYKTKCKSYLKQHSVKSHCPNEIQWFECENCDFKSKWKHALKQHYVLKHRPGEIKWFQCDHCDFKTKRKSYLKKHIPLKHPHH